MFDFGKICKKYEQMTDSQRRETLVRDSAVILPALSAVTGDPDSTFILFVMTACAASGRLEPEEYALFSDVTGISLDYGAACAMINTVSTKESRSVIDIIVDTFGALNEDIKASMISFCLCFCAANGRIDGKERKFIKMLIK